MYKLVKIVSTVAALEQLDWEIPTDYDGTDFESLLKDFETYNQVQLEDEALNRFIISARDYYLI